MQRGILGPGPALRTHLALRFMRMRLMPPMAFPFADMQQFPFDHSMMPIPSTATAEVLNGTVDKYILYLS